MKTVRTTINVLRQFSAAEPELGVSEIARRLNLDKATVHRVLKTLIEERFVEQDPLSKRYRLGFAVLDLASARMGSFGFLSDAAAEIRALGAALNESVAIHALDGHEMICLDFATFAHPVSVSFFVGERFPVHVTSPGLASLSTMPRTEWKPLLERANHLCTIAVPEARMVRTLEEVRRSGFAVADQSYERGIRAIAVPVCDAAGAVVCTVSIAAPAQRRTVEALKKFAPHLLQVAERLRRSLGAGRPSIVRARGE